MKKAGDILSDLGFNANAPEGAQKAFLKNLARAAYGAEVTDLQSVRNEKQKPTNSVQKQHPEEVAKKVVNGESVQLSFKFNE